MCADFTQPFEIPVRNHCRTIDPRVLPGSTIGNFDRSEAIALLAMMRELAGPEGRVLVGADLRKSPRILEAAYNDTAGVTAEFNLNLLARLNHEFGADFDLGAFMHRAPWVEEQSRIEMHLVSTCRQTVHIGECRGRVRGGESIWTESCHKYDRAQFAAMARESKAGH